MGIQNSKFSFVNSGITMFKKLVNKFILPAFPNLYLSSKGFEVLQKKERLPLEFINDYYLYKDIDNGYSALYSEFNLQGEKIFFGDFHDNINDLLPHLQEELHTFNWLQDLKIVDNEAASFRVVELLKSWVDSHNNKPEALVYNYLVLGQRIFNWLTSDTIVKFSEEKVSHKILDSLSFQIRLFLKTYKLDISINTPKICKILFTIGKATENKGLYKTAINMLLRYLEQNFLADGGNETKCPYITFNQLADIVFIYKNLLQDENDTKSQFRNYIDKIMVFIKTLRYEDGGLGVFYRGYEGYSNEIDFVLSLGGINASPFHSLRYSGYLSLRSKNGVNLTLKTPEYTLKSDAKVLDNNILSQEITIRKERIFINNSSYSPYFKEKANPKIIARDEFSAILLYDRSGLINMPSKLSNVDCKVEQRVDHNWNSVLAVYNGLKSSHNLTWHKALHLEKHHGDCLLGEEFLTLNSHSGITKAVLRFIMYPGILIKDHLSSNRGFFFDVEGEEWIFRASEALELSKGIYKGIKGELLPCYIIDIPINLKEKIKGLEWSLMKISTIIDKVKHQEENSMEAAIDMVIKKPEPFDIDLVTDDLNLNSRKKIKTKIKHTKITSDTTNTQLNNMDIKASPNKVENTINTVTETLVNSTVEATNKNKGEYKLKPDNTTLSVKLKTSSINVHTTQATIKTKDIKLEQKSFFNDEILTSDSVIDDMNKVVKELNHKIFEANISEAVVGVKIKNPKFLDAEANSLQNQDLHTSSLPRVDTPTVINLQNSHNQVGEGMEVNSNVKNLYHDSLNTAFTEDKHGITEATNHLNVNLYTHNTNEITAEKEPNIATHVVGNNTIILPHLRKLSAFKPYSIKEDNADDKPKVIYNENLTTSENTSGRLTSEKLNNEEFTNSEINNKWLNDDEATDEEFTSYEEFNNMKSDNLEDGRIRHVKSNNNVANSSKESKEKSSNYLFIKLK